MFTQKMHEVQKYMTTTDHGVIEYAVITNKKFWDALPADIRTTLEGAMVDATKYANEIAKKENDDAIEGVKKSGKTQIITLTKEEKAVWKKALVQVHRDQESRIASTRSQLGFRNPTLRRQTDGPDKGVRNARPVKVTGP